MERRSYLTAMAAVAGAPISNQLIDGEDDTGDGGDEHGGDETESDPRPPADLVGIFDDFETLEPWRAYQGIGSISSTTAYTADGNQSALLEPREEDGQVRVRRELDEPIDVRAVAPGITVAADRDARVRLQLQDSSGHYVEFSRQVRSEMPFVSDNFGLSRVSGDPDLTDVVTVQIVSWFGERTDGRLAIDDLYFVPTLGTGTVCLQFHGGYESHYTDAFEVLEDADTDVPAAAFVPPDRIPGEDRLTLEALETLSAAGWTVGSYGARGTPINGSGEEMESTVTSPIDWLTERGFDDGARYLAVPGSQYSEDSYEAVRAHYDLAFSGWGLSQGYPSDPHRCTVTDDPDPEQAVELLEWTAARGGVTSIAFTSFDTDEDREALEELVARLDELVAQDLLEVGTPDDLLDAANELEAAVADDENGDDVVDDPDDHAIDDEGSDDVDPDEEMIEESERDATEERDGSQGEPSARSHEPDEAGENSEDEDGDSLEEGTDRNVDDILGDPLEDTDGSWSEIGPNESVHSSTR